MEDERRRRWDALISRWPAEAAERPRNKGVDIIFVAGCVYTIFSKGVFPGGSSNECGAWFGAQLTGSYTLENIPEIVPEKSTKRKEILRSFAATIRTELAGPLTYSAGTWEPVHPASVIRATTTFQNRKYQP